MPARPFRSSAALRRSRITFVSCIISIGASGAEPDGAALYDEHCASCHDTAVYKAPSRMMLAGMAPRAVLAALSDGTMRTQAASLDTDEREAIAEFVTRRRLDAIADAKLPPQCDATRQFDPSKRPCPGMGWISPTALSTARQRRPQCGQRRRPRREMGVRLSGRVPGAIAARLRRRRHLRRQPGRHGIRAGCRNRLSTLVFRGQCGSTHRRRDHAVG